MAPGGGGGLRLGRIALRLSFGPGLVQRAVHRGRFVLLDPGQLLQPGERGGQSLFLHCHRRLRRCLGRRDRGRVARQGTQDRIAAQGFCR